MMTDYRFLGVTVDCRLNWNSSVDVVRTEGTDFVSFNIHNKKFEIGCGHCTPLLVLFVMCVTSQLTEVIKIASFNIGSKNTHLNLW